MSGVWRSFDKQEKVLKCAGGLLSFLTYYLSTAHREIITKMNEKKQKTKNFAKLASHMALALTQLQIVILFRRV